MYIDPMIYVGSAYGGYIRTFPRVSLWWLISIVGILVGLIGGNFLIFLLTGSTWSSIIFMIGFSLIPMVLLWIYLIPRTVIYIFKGGLAIRRFGTIIQSFSYSDISSVRLDDGRLKLVLANGINTDYPFPYSGSEQIVDEIQQRISNPSFDKAEE